MGNSSTQEGEAQGAQPGDMECSICLSAIERRAGVAVMSPGCCGSFFHQSCVDALIKSGNSSCPNCRAQFPGTILPPPPTAPTPAPVPVPHLRQPAPPHRSRVVIPHQSRALSPDEELLDRSDPSTSSSSPPSNIFRPSSSIAMECTPERNVMTTQDCANFFVNVNLKALGSAGSTKRTPLDIVCVLDNSGSMSGSKFDSVKEAMRYVRSQLTPEDRLAIVIFNSFASVLHGLMTMTDENRNKSEAALGAMFAQGGTDIFAGLSSAETILSSRRTMNTLSCVFLLTDGQDGSRQQEKADLARRLKALGQSLYVFGFGNDHNSAQMQMLANAAEGPFTFIESDDVVVDAFGGALGGQQGVIGKDIKLTMTMAEVEGLSVLECVSGRYSSTLSRDRKSVVVTFANIFAGEQRDVMLKLNVPACSAEIAKYDILSTRVTFKTIHDEVQEGIHLEPSQAQAPSPSVGMAAAMETADDAKAETKEADEGSSSSSSSSSELASSSVSLSSAEPSPTIAPSAPSTVAVCSVRRVAKLLPEDEAQVNVAVDVQKNRHLVTTSIAEALRRADGRDLAAARASLTTVLATVQASASFTAGHPMALAQVDDLNEALEKLRSEHEYFTMGGRHVMTETVETVEMQRCVYSKACKKASPYQSLASGAMQSDAMSKKARK